MVKVINRDSYLNQLVEKRIQTDTPPVWTTSSFRRFSPNVPMSLSRRILHALHIAC